MSDSSNTRIQILLGLWGVGLAALVGHNLSGLMTPLRDVAHVNCAWLSDRHAVSIKLVVFVVTALAGSEIGEIAH